LCKGDSVRTRHAACPELDSESAFFVSFKFVIPGLTRNLYVGSSFPLALGLSGRRRESSVFAVILEQSEESRPFVQKVTLPSFVILTLIKAFFVQFEI